MSASHDDNVISPMEK